MAIQLFIPCYIDQFSPQVGQSLCTVLDKLNISWKYQRSQTCCGQFAFNAGDWQSARLLMRHFFKVFNTSDPIICPSASCVLTIRHHYSNLIETPDDAAQLNCLQSLIFEFSEWFAKVLPLPFPLAWPGKIFLHNSCSARQLGVLSHLKKILNYFEELHLTESAPDQSCCGFGGLFSYKCPDLSMSIGSAYLQSIMHSNATALVAPDVGCLLHFKKILLSEKISFPMYHPVELISQAVQDR